jgi:Methyltransferase domain
LNRHEFLAQMHRLTLPRSYLEIGINDGKSLALSRTRSIGVDPEFKINVELECDVQLVKATSDDFFARSDAIAWFPEAVADLIFIDGLHLFEFALRDFINAEKVAHPGSVMVFDDMLPRTVEEAARGRRTKFWAGDVFKVALVLERYRPDLVVIPLDTTPTGLLLVVGLDPTSTVLQDNYDAVVAAFSQDDPQDVPPEILNRTRAADPGKVVALDLFEALSSHHAQGQLPDFAVLRSLRGSATYQSAPYDNPSWPPVRAAKKATAVAKKTKAGKANSSVAKRPTMARRLKRAVRAFLA